MNNRIASAAFVDFHTVKIAAVEPVGGNVGLRISDGNGFVADLLCAEHCGKTEFELAFEFEFEPGTTYYAAFVDRDTYECSERALVCKRPLYDTAEFEKRFAYGGKLGVKYGAAKSTFSVWAPFASAVVLNIYNSGERADTVRIVHAMTRADKGVWTTTVSGRLAGKFYTYSVEIDGEVREAVDPYAVSAGRNGERGMIIDMKKTDPEGWDEQAVPEPLDFSSYVIYEAHLRDLTMHESSNVSPENRGKFLGMTERGTDGKKTPLDYLEELGVTAVHFQPLFDFASVNEDFDCATFDREGEFNWGYDPLNYNVPEGSYSSDPSDGSKRVTEMKAMIAALHNAGIRVIMDVVYNHVNDAATSCFQVIAPGYFFRTDTSGNFLNGSGCGNETASERVMFRKYMVDSVKHWAKEYKIDGFRFDLMALHDVKTMNEICEELKKINPNAVVYGEGWDAGSNGLPPELRANKYNADKMPDVAFFDDIVRDGIRGSVFNVRDTGFASGKLEAASAVYAAACGATDILDAAVYHKLGADKAAFAANPAQNINYVSVHDNSTLWDKLNASVNAERPILKSINRLAAVAVMTGQGASLLLAGEELLRSKKTDAGNAFNNSPQKYLTYENYYYADNSYRSPDSVNAIDWRLAEWNSDMVEFYRALIGIKTRYPQFGIADKSQLAELLHIREAADGVAAFAVCAPDSDEYAVVAINADTELHRVAVPRGNYAVLVDGDCATDDADSPIARFDGDMYTIAPRSAVVMIACLDSAVVYEWAKPIAEFAGFDLSAALDAGIKLPKTVLIAGGKIYGI